MVHVVSLAESEKVPSKLLAGLRKHHLTQKSWPNAEAQADVDDQSPCLEDVLLLSPGIATYGIDVLEDVQPGLLLCK